jgi:hypothetical protein
MGQYVDVDAEGTITLKLPEALADRHAELVAKLEERFGFEGLTADREAEIDQFVTELVGGDPA